MHRIEIELEQRIVILDGAMGTMIQRYGLEEKDYRCDRLQLHSVELKGNTDLLNLSRPDIIREIHGQYLEAGADIISTNTFGANSISQSDYGTSALVAEINYQGASIAREAADEMYQADPSKPRFVAGAMGPTTKLASMSPQVNDPGFRAIHFDQLVEAYTEQANALIEGRIDLFLLETITDTLNAKAALFALEQLFEQMGRKYPIMVSGTITDASGRILSGQTIEAFLISLSHAPLLSVGLNCALGASELKPYLPVLDKASSCYVSTHPNAGLPNQFGSYDQTPDEFASLLYDFARNGWVNIVGGCCGTTPQHIKAAANALRGIPPRPKSGKKKIANEHIMTDQAIRELIEKWCHKETREGKPTFTMQELLHILSEVEDEKTFLQLKSTFDQEKKLYHAEQAMLLNANIFGRYQYLRAENRLKIVNVGR